MSTWFGSSAATIGFVVASTAAAYLTTVICVRLAVKGVADPSSAALVLLEPDGTVSVLTDDADLEAVRADL